MRPSKKGPEPRIPFCWWCGQPLVNGIFETVPNEDGVPMVVHKGCAGPASESTRRITAQPSIRGDREDE